MKNALIGFAVIAASLSALSARAAHESFGLPSPIARVTCSQDAKLSRQIVEVRARIRYVTVQTSVSASTGYTWESVEGLSSKIIPPAKNAPIGAPARMFFDINVEDQAEASRDYTFVFKRPWEAKKDSICIVTVKRN